MLEEPNYLLEIPRLRVQNANAISSPLTWGFPAMTAFVGLMHTLERKLAERDVAILFDSVGVICHRHEPQISAATFPRTFRLTRNPVDKYGDTAAIVEEGRTHLEITLVFSVRGDACQSPENEQVARQIEELSHTLRIAGGTLQPTRNPRRRSTRIIPVTEDAESRPKEYRKLLRQWLPGFALVARDDLLQSHWKTLREKNVGSTLLDAWLDLSRLNWECHQEESADTEKAPTVHWEPRRPRGSSGWIVPIPVGYGALGPLQDPGTVSAARDAETPFRFVESLYSIGQWIGPHRLTSPKQLLWYPESDPDNGRYRLRNDYEPNVYA